MLAVVLILAACTVSTPSPTPTPTPTPSPSTTPGPSGLGVSAAAQAYLVPIRGYAYEALPSAVVHQTIAALQTPQILQYLLGYAAASVTNDQVGQAVAVVFEVDPSYLASQGAMSDFIAGLAGLASATVKEVTLVDSAGGALIDAYELTSPAQQMLVWRTDPLIVVIVGSDLPTVTAIATALVDRHS